MRTLSVALAAVSCLVLASAPASAQTCAPYAKSIIGTLEALRGTHADMMSKVKHYIAFAGNATVDDLEIIQTRRKQVAASAVLLGKRTENFDRASTTSWNNNCLTDNEYQEDRKLVAYYRKLVADHLRITQ